MIILQPYIKTIDLTLFLCAYYRAKSQSIAARHVHPSTKVTISSYLVLTKHFSLNTRAFVIITDISSIFILQGYKEHTLYHIVFCFKFQNFQTANNPTKQNSSWKDLLVGTVVFWFVTNRWRLVAISSCCFRALDKIFYIFALPLSRCSNIKHIGQNIWT